MNSIKILFISSEKMKISGNYIYDDAIDKIIVPIKMATLSTVGTIYFLFCIGFYSGDSICKKNVHD